MPERSGDGIIRASLAGGGDHADDAPTASGKRVSLFVNHCVFTVFYLAVKKAPSRFNSLTFPPDTSMKIKNLSHQTPTLDHTSHHVASPPNDHPQADPAKKDRNSTFQAAPAPVNYIRALPRDVLHAILETLDEPSQKALSFTDKALLRLYGRFLSKGFDRLVHDIFKVKPNRHHQDIFNTINRELQRHKIINLNPADKFAIHQFFEKHVSDPKTARNLALTLSATQMGVTITARHRVATIEKKFVSQDDDAQLQQHLDEFTATFADRGLAETSKIMQFLAATRQLPHPEAFMSKLYRAVQHDGDSRTAQALANVLATIGCSLLRRPPESFTGATTFKGVLQELNILRDMLHAATPIAGLLARHSLSDHFASAGYGRENALVVIQQEVEGAIDRIKRSRPASLTGRMGHLLKSRFN